MTETIDQDTFIAMDMPEADYHAHPAVSRSALWRLHNWSPWHAMYGTFEATAAMDLGSAVHCSVLEPGLFWRRFKRGPADRRGNKWKEAVEEAKPATLLTEGDYDTALAMSEAVWGQVGHLLPERMHREVSAFWRDEATGLQCRARADAWSQDVIVDLKTTTDARPDSFARSVAQYGYHLQDAMYCRGFQEATAGVYQPRMIFVVVEKQPPYLTAVYELDIDARLEGERIFHTAMARWAECAKADEWPGYGAEVQPLSLPRWAMMGD